MLTVFNHPLITHKLAIMRDKNTSTKDFAQLLDEIGSLMTYEVFRELPTKTVQVETPMGICTTKMLDKEVILIPILRAGLGMVQGIRNLVPTAKVGFIGLYRNEETLEPIEYYAKYPKDIDKAFTIIVDPMLATGGSAIAAIKSLKDKGATDVNLVCLVGAPEGVARIQREFPDVDIYLAAMDEKLNDIGYIVPGLGDAGDRIFGTK